MAVTIPSLGKPGRPTRFKFSDLFLISPMHEFALNGISLASCIPDELGCLRGMFQDFGRKNGYRRISKQRYEQLFTTLRKVMPTQISERLIAAFHDEHLPEIGLWECYVSGALEAIPGDFDTSKLRHISRIIIEREQALRAPTEAFFLNDFVRCADLLASSASIKPFLCDDTIRRIRTAQKQDDLIVVRILVAIEMRLSGIAYWDAVLCRFHGFNGPYFVQFFPDNDDTHRGVVRNFLDWLAEYSGVGQHLAEHFFQLAKPAKNFDLASAKRQVRRWKSDEVFPSNDVIYSCLRSLFDKKSPLADPKKWAVSDHVFETCRRIKFLTDFLALFPAEPSGPVLSLTHGAVKTDDWRDSRYQHWFDHWMKQECTASPTASTDKPCPPPY